ncbi:MAG: 2-C-methyl-D-erythritol 4-phosphate cytidylyltransferase [Firmicutes bacterium]|nr:2-C-methyl-D-erythritol 4-phosphate cytidylyltransferase [Bacillota bacterium]
MGQVVAIVPAAGKGVRMGLEGGKQFIQLAGKPVLARTLLALEDSKEIEAIIVVTAEYQVDLGRQIVREYGIGKVRAVIPGGESRQASVWAGLRQAADIADVEVVLVHDGARPLVDVALIDGAVAAARLHGAVGVAVPVKDTIKVRDAEGFVASTPPREDLWAIQTPQAFQFDILWEAHTQALAENWTGTDDCMLVEMLGRRVELIEGSYRNIKLTTKEDLILAAALLADEGEDEPIHTSNPPSPRVGMGYDVHMLVEGRPLILGGVEIPYEKGLLGHSDADVLVHAIIDAILGGLALGDIGRHFPDTDPKWRGANSLGLLRQVKEQFLPGNRSCPSISHIDCVIVAQRPKLAPYIEQMRKNIAQVLGISISQVGIKATTSEGLGLAGRGEGMVAQAVVTILA